MSVTSIFLIIIGMGVPQISDDPLNPYVYVFMLFCNVHNLTYICTLCLFRVIGLISQETTSGPLRSLLSKYKEFKSTFTITDKRFLCRNDRFSTVSYRQLSWGGSGSGSCSTISVDGVGTGGGSNTGSGSNIGGDGDDSGSGSGSIILVEWWWWCFW